AATNQAGDSDFSNTIQAAPTLAPPVLTAPNVTSAAVTLLWSQPPVANDHYRVERSTTPDFASPVVLATNIPGNQRTFTDTAPPRAPRPGRYSHRAPGSPDQAEPRSAVSNVVAARVGPLSAVIDYHNGFPSAPTDLQANGSAQFAESTARLTNANNQAGSVF